MHDREAIQIKLEAAVNERFDSVLHMMEVELGNLKGSIEEFQEELRKF